jgi:hypothetical protein
MKDDKKYDKKYDIPKPTAGDVSIVGVKAAVQLIPMIGGPISTWMDIFITSPFQHRLQAWYEDVTSGLRLLETQVEDLYQRLDSDERFTSAAITLTRYAVETHTDDVRHAFIGALLNTAKGISIEDAEHHSFLRYLGQCTDWHIRLIVLFGGGEITTNRDPGETLDFILGKAIIMVEDHFPELTGKRSMVGAILQDLKRELYT